MRTRVLGLSVLLLGYMLDRCRPKDLGHTLCRHVCVCWSAR